MRKTILFPIGMAFITLCIYYYVSSDIYKIKGEKTYEITFQNGEKETVKTLINPKLISGCIHLYIKEETYTLCGVRSYKLIK